ncbi:MAG TPA: hypothetical protein VGI40_20730 [Pirellulaceae bacterium]|jgi:hypothetical protein
MKNSLVAVLLVFVLLVTSSRAQQPKAAQKGQGGAPTLDQLFAMLDRDRDGRIAKNESVGAYAQRFAAWDANGDGFASREEVRAYRAMLGFDDQGVYDGKSRPPAGQQKGGGPKAAPATAQLLKEPADWRLETFPVPPPFAPDIKFTGSEEARFAPGMYDTNSSEYFTYVMVFALDGMQQLTAADLKEFVERYFGGLSESVGRRKGLKIDRSQIVATVTPQAAASPVEKRFDADLVFFDSFTDGRKTTLHLDAQVLPRPNANKQYWILLVSPAAKDSASWDKLREIGKKTTAAILE